MTNISIIIPCRNEAKHITACIDSVLESGFPIENINEFVLCDGNSTDETAAIVATYSKRFPFIQLLNNPEQTVPYALNKAISCCTAPVIVRFDAHSTMQKGYINYGLEVLEKDKTVGNVGGIFINKYENETAECIAAAMQSRFGVGNATFRLADRDGYVDTVPYGIFRSEVFEKTGLFDTMLTRNQDDEMNHRIAAAGYKLYLDRRIKVNYMVRGSLTKLWQQYFQYGYFKVLVNRKHQTITSVRQLVPMLFVAGIVCGLIVSTILPILLLPFIAVLGIYTILGMLSAYQSHTENRSFSRISTTFFCFIILHCAYGLGYWNGIFDFLILRKAKPDTKNEKQS
jgi:glycosyltransferase involved in cell wall biosynthesis